MIVHDDKGGINLLGEVTAIDRVMHDQLWQLAAMLCDRLVVLGTACSDATCGRLARWTCFWPGQTAVKCTEHRDGWTRVAEVMGFELVSKPLDVQPDGDPTSVRFQQMELE